MTIIIHKKARRKKLSDCPVGLFFYGEELCMKTEYATNDGKIMAYIVSSGEFFAGLPPGPQRNLLVHPATVEAYP
jgi:hypothetical protein